MISLELVAESIVYNEKCYDIQLEVLYRLDDIHGIIYEIQPLIYLYELNELTQHLNQEKITLQHDIFKIREQEIEDFILSQISYEL